MDNLISHQHSGLLLQQEEVRCHLSSERAERRQARFQAAKAILVLGLPMSSNKAVSVYATSQGISLDKQSK